MFKAAVPLRQPIVCPRARPRRFPVVAVIALLVAPALVATPAAAQSSQAVVTWTYTLGVADAAAGLMRVRIDFEGSRDVVQRFGFRTEGHSQPIHSVEGPEGALTQTPDGVNLWVRGADPWLEFVVDVRQAAHGAGHAGGGADRTGQYTSYLEANWGVIKAESFALTFNYTFFESRPPAFSARVKADLPSGWNMATPWAEDAGGWRLPAGEVLPRGFLALGRLYEDVTHVDGREIRYARIGTAPALEGAIFRYIRDATPYLRAIYGDNTADATLVIAAPAPMFDGGLADADTVYLSHKSELRILAHEYAHSWQRFAVKTTAGESVLWLNEGDADLHGTLSLVATGDWTMAEANTWLRRQYEDGAGSRVPVTDSAYGNEHERLAYQKGVFIGLALDELIGQATGGAKGYPDLLRALNEPFGARDGKKPEPLANVDVLEAVNTLTNWDSAPFFHKYVYGVDWPPLKTLRATAETVATSIRTDPPTPREGAPTLVIVTVENRGLAPSNRDVALTLDNTVVGSKPVSLAIGGRDTLTFAITAPAPGSHVLRTLSTDAVLHVVTPPSLVISRVSVLPVTPRLGATVDVLAYVTNAGEAEGRGTVTLLIDGGEHATRPVTVGGNGTRTVIFSLELVHGGKHSATVQLRSDGRASEGTATFTMGARDRDGDGVADVEDAYPDNPRFQHQSFGASVEDITGLPASITASVAGAAIALGAGVYLFARRVREPPRAAGPRAPPAQSDGSGSEDSRREPPWPAQRPPHRGDQPDREWRRERD